MQFSRPSLIVPWENLACCGLQLWAGFDSVDFLGCLNFFCASGGWYVGFQPISAFVWLCCCISLPKFASKLSRLVKLGHFWASLWRQFGGNFYADLDGGLVCRYVSTRKARRCWRRALTTRRGCGTRRPGSASRCSRVTPTRSSAALSTTTETPSSQVSEPARPFHCSLSFSSSGLTTWFPRLLLLLLAYPFSLFIFSVLQFLVVVSVR